MKKLLIPLAIFMAVIFTGVAFAATAAIFSVQETGQTGHVDPIVSPGVRSAHEHCFYGAVGVTPTSTSADLRNSPTTWQNQANHTAIWIPCVYEDGRLLHAEGTHLNNTGHLLAYYFGKPDACVPPENTGGVTRDYGYRTQLGGGAFSTLPPARSDSGYLVVNLRFRGLRDFGVSCFPSVGVFVRLWVGTGPIGTITLGGPTLGVDGAAGPLTMHGDYLFGWERDAFERFLARCVRPNITCGKNPVT